MKTKPTPARSWNDLGVSTGNSNGNSEAALRQRAQPIGPTSETQALNALNTRPPAADANHEWQIEDGSPVSNRPNQPLSPVGARRSSEVDEAYGLLRRQSTRGKRRESYGLAAMSNRNSNSVPIIEEPTSSVASFSYHDYAREVANNNNNGRPSAQNKTSQNKQQSPPLQGSKPGDNGFGASTYNPYVQTAPIYEYPPGRPSEDGAASLSGLPYPSQSRSNAPGSRPGPGSSTQYAAELEAERKH
jgi:hypothetical protein